MRRLIVSSLMTLDGVSEDPVGWENREHGGWSRMQLDQKAADDAYELIRSSEIFLCGRVTYEGFARFGYTRAGRVAEALNAKPKLVASRTLSGPLEWNSTAIDGDVVERVLGLKGESGGHILSYGGPRLISTLMQHDLVDEFRISVYPIVLGAGGRLFPGDGHEVRGLDLIEATTLGSGVVALTYRRA